MVPKGDDRLSFEVSAYFQGLLLLVLVLGRLSSFHVATNHATNRLGKLLMSHTAFSCTTHLNDKTKIFSIEIEVSSKKFLTEKCFSINQIKTSGIIL